MPDLLEAPLAAVGEKLGDRLDLVRLDPAYHARFADGSAIDVHTDADAMEQEIREQVSARDAAGYRRLRDWLGELYRVQMATFIDANFDSPLDVLSPDLRPARRARRVRAARTAHRPVPRRRAPAPRLLVPGALRGRARRPGRSRPTP